MWITKTYQKRGLLHTLLYRSFHIFCDFKTFNSETDHFKNILMKNYPLNIKDSCIKSFLSKLYKIYYIQNDQFTRESNVFKLKTMESLLIARDKLILKNADSTLLLKLFQDNISGFHMMFYHII